MADLIVWVDNRMTYRCRSCGSNATADLQCEYCGAGTRSRRLSKPARSSAQRPPSQPAVDFDLFLTVALLGVAIGTLLFVVVKPWKTHRQWKLIWLYPNT